MVEALKPVTHAILGDLEDMFRPIRKIKPDIITLGCNQLFDPETLRASLEKQGIITEIVRISQYSDSPFTSSRGIVREIVQRSHPQDRPGENENPDRREEK